MISITIYIYIYIYILPIIKLLYRFSKKNVVKRPVFKVKVVIFCFPHKTSFFEISIFFDMEKSAELVSYIVSALV